MAGDRALFHSLRWRPNSAGSAVSTRSVRGPSRAGVALGIALPAKGQVQDLEMLLALGLQSDSGGQNRYS